MDVFDAIKKRRSIRSFKSDEVPNDVLEELLEAMRLAPSAGNKQPWKFVVVRDEEKRRRIVNACHHKSGSSKNEVVVQSRFADAPVLIIACSDEKDGTFIYHENGETVAYYDWEIFMDETNNDPGHYESCHLFDLSIALTHLTLAAASKGLGTCWIGGLSEDEVKEIVSVPKDVRAPFVMAVGYPTEWPEVHGSRKTLQEIVSYEQFK